MIELEGLVYPTTPPLRGFNDEWSKAVYAIIGFPFDSTSSYRPGSRFGPAHIRMASLMIESISLFTKVDIARIPMIDLGDLAVVHGNPELTLKRLKEALDVVISAGKKPVVLGGEHTLTYGVIRALRDKGLTGDDFYLVSLDAHMDLYDEWPLGQRISHATVMRRLFELLNADQLVLLGVRACDNEELSFAEEHGIDFISSFELTSQEDTLGELLSALREKHLYLSLDLDVLDPSMAPGVGNPEAGGLSYHQLLSVLKLIIRSAKSLIGFDLVEFNPLMDRSGVTDSVAARLVYEVLSLDFTRR
mgnify:CR=1 FL=1